ncbi:YtxH domain-containing protein [Alteribacillus sp. HJP-4]|uniref:YtxH domain-containing protein n=1 Tax=Alteribacillus sp. HJP-4 TaxID=2775394 RepID=UPI0035CCC8A3
MDSKSLCTGILTGLIIGGFSALLSAPASGTDVRSSVRNYDWRSLNRRAADKGRNTMKDWQFAASEGFEAVDGLTQEMKRTYSRYKEEVEPEVESIQKQVKEISDAISSLNEQIRLDPK